jgi:hypothetical protein
MRKTAILRGIMLTTGILAVCAILLSASFSQVKFKEQVKKEQSSDKETLLIPAPADAIPGSAVKLDQPSIPRLTQLPEPEKKVSHPIVRSQEIGRFLKVLFRTLISPNAP